MCRPRNFPEPTPPALRQVFIVLETTMPMAVSQLYLRRKNIHKYFTILLEALPLALAIPDASGVTFPVSSELTEMNVE